MSDVASVVRILLKKRGSDPIDLKSVIHHALVRRKKVVALILHMKQLGHPSYVNVDDGEVKRRARELPENDVPKEFWEQVANDDSIDKLQPQKAATPVAGRLPEDQKDHAFRHVRPHDVVQERSCADHSDINEQRIAAMRHVADVER